MDINNIKTKFINAISKNKSYIEYAGDSTRNKGKTRLLIELAEEFKIPILTNGYGHHRYIKLLNSKIKLIDNLKDINSNIILIDEGLRINNWNSFNLDMLENKIKVIGFHRF
jgi:hypothetical protein